MIRQHSSAVQKHPKHGSGAMSIQGRSAGSKSTVDESLLCYGGPRDEEVDEMIHENFQEKECCEEPSPSRTEQEAPRSVP